MNYSLFVSEWTVALSDSFIIYLAMNFKKEIEAFKMTQ